MVSHFFGMDLEYRLDRREARHAKRIRLKSANFDATIVSSIWKELMTEDLKGLVDDGLLATLLPFNPKPCLALKRDLMDDDKIPVGSSKLGGQPDLPADTDLPMDDDYECTFVGQINFAQTSKTRFASMLPDQGLLSVFLLTSDSEEPDVECIYTPDTAALIRHQLPESATTSNPVRLSFQEWLTIPTRYPLDLPDETLEEIELLSQEEDRYRDLTDRLMSEFNSRFYPDPPNVDGEVVDIPDNYSPPLHQMFGYHYDMNGTERAPSEKWLLMLQIFSDFATGSSFFDHGDLYLWIREKDLLLRRFDKIDLEIQT